MRLNFNFKTGLKIILKLFFYIIIISLIISFYMFIHEFGHALFAWSIGAKVEEIKMYGFGIWFFSGKCYTETTLIGQTPIISLGGHIISFCFWTPLYLYYKWKLQDNLWIHFTIFIIIYKEIFYIAISPLIMDGDMFICAYWCFFMNLNIIGCILLGICFVFLFFSVFTFIKYLINFSKKYEEKLLNRAIRKIEFRLL